MLYWTAFFFYIWLVKSHIPDDCLKDTQLGGSKNIKKKLNQSNNLSTLQFYSSFIQSYTFYMAKISNDSQVQNKTIKLHKKEQPNLSVYLSVYQSIYLSVYPPIHPFIQPAISICLYILILLYQALYFWK